MATPIAEKSAKADAAKKDKPNTDRKPRASKKLDTETLKGHINALNLTEKVALLGHIKENISQHRKDIQGQLALIDQTNGQLHS